jgi:YfiH family protein
MPLGVDLAQGVEVWFSGAQLERTEPGMAVGSTSGVVERIDGNLAHHRPHHPVRLAAAREAFAAITRTDVDGWHLMRQVHGAEVGIVDADVRVGTELREVDALVTALPGRPLVVLAADCLPIMLAGPSVVAAVHAGWRGLVKGVIGATVRTMVALGDDPRQIRAVVGPGIGPCCYEVGEDVVEQVSARSPDAVSVTSRGSRSIDLRAVARAQLAALRVEQVELPVPSDGGVPDGQPSTRHARSTLCTSCGPGWFSHRRDPCSGRQAGLIVRRVTGAEDGLRDDA